MGSLKLTTVGVFTPQKLANATDQGSVFPESWSFKHLSARHSVRGLGLNQILDLGQVMPPLQVSAPIHLNLWTQHPFLLWGPAAPLSQNALLGSASPVDSPYVLIPSISHHLGWLLQTKWPLGGQFPFQMEASGRRHHPPDVAWTVPSCIWRGKTPAQGSPESPKWYLPASLADTRPP